MARENADAAQEADQMLRGDQDALSVLRKHILCSGKRHLLRKVFLIYGKGLENLNYKEKKMEDNFVTFLKMHTN